MPGAVRPQHALAPLLLRGAAPALAVLLMIDVVAARPTRLWHLVGLTLLLGVATVVGVVRESRASKSLRALTGTVERASPCD